MTASTLTGALLCGQFSACSKPAAEEEILAIVQDHSTSGTGSELLKETPEPPPVDAEPSAASPTLVEDDQVAPPPSTLDPAPHFEEEAFLALLGLAPVPPFYVSDLLTPEDVAMTLGFATKIEVREVPGLAPSPFHNGLRLTRTDALAGVIFEVRYTPDLLAQVHTFEYLRRTNQHETMRIEIGSEAFWSSHGDTTRIVCRDERTKTIISVTCDEKACQVPSLLTFIRTAHSRLNG